MVVRHIVNEFKILYSISGALWLTQRLNFSIRSPRPVPYNCATPEKQKEYAENVVKMIKKYDDEHYKFLCLDAAGFVDAPSCISLIMRLRLRLRYLKSKIFDNCTKFYLVVYLQSS